MGHINLEKFIPLMLNNAQHGRPLPIYGDGSNIRDWLYVVDHCEAIVRVLEQGAVGESYNIGGHNEKKNLEIVELLCDLLDEKSKRSAFRASLVVPLSPLFGTGQGMIGATQLMLVKLSES